MFGKKAKAGREKESFKKMMANIMKLITGEQKLSERAYGKVKKRLIRTARIAFASTAKFLEDDCLTKASSIAYTTIVSLIPTLAVGLTFFSIFGVGNQKEEIFTKITKLMAEYNLSRLNIDPYLDMLSSIIDNAASIGGVGAVVLIFSATAILRTLEHSLNTIWGVKKERSWVAKMIYYWATLTLGPIMLIAGTTLAAQVSTAITKPNYHAVSIEKSGRVWVAGNKAAIRYTDHDFSTFAKIDMDGIDFDNQAVMSYDHASSAFQDDDYRYDIMEFMKADFSDIQFVGQNGWAVGRNGIILSTQNGGKNWKISKWGSFSFTTIRMTDETHGVIASEGGYLLTTENGGDSWNVLSWPELTGNIKSISFSGKTGIAVCDKSFIIKSIDGGKSWTPVRLEKLKIKKKYTNFNSISLSDEKHGWIAADDGMIITTNDGFATYDIRHFREYKYTTALSLSPAEGYVGGENGVLLYTNDGGNTWQRKILHRGNINRIALSDKALWAAGDSGLLMFKGADHKWKGEKGTGLIIYFINFLGPFVFIWLSFLLIYALLPNTKVPFKPAAIGASITGAIWVGFILGFIVYVKSFANGTFAIYGALAAFPIFLLLVYTSAVIILYGAEVSYIVVHLDSYIRKRRIRKSRNELSVYAGLRIIFHVYSKFEKGKGGSSLSEIQKLCEKADDSEYYINLFKTNGLILEAQGHIMPATASETIRMANLIDLIHDASLSIPANTPDDQLKKTIGALFDDMNESRKKIIGDITLADIVKA